MVGAWLQSEDSVCVWDGGLTLEPWGLCPMFTIHPRLGDDRIGACPLGQISLWPQEGPRGTDLLTVPSIVSVKLECRFPTDGHLEPPVQAWGVFRDLNCPAASGPALTGQVANAASLPT